MATAKTKAQLQAEAKKKKLALEAKAEKAAAAAPAVDAPAGAEINLQNLTHIVTATNSETGFCYATAAVAKPLFDAGMVDVNGDAVNPTPSGEEAEYATRATPAGIAYVASKASPFAGGAPAASPAAAPAPFGVPGAAPAASAASATRSQAVAPEGGFKIVTGVPLPVVTRTFGPKKSIYPFGTLEVGASFFVPSTAARPNPAKQMASTVNSATSRFSIEDGTEMKDGVEVAKFKKTRTFALRGIDADMTHADGSKGGAPWGYPGQGGAAVFRTA